MGLKMAHAEADTIANRSPLACIRAPAAQHCGLCYLLCVVSRLLLLTVVTGEPLPNLRPPWFFDCSNHPRYSAFRQRYADFRNDFPVEDWQSEAFLEAALDIFLEAN